MSLEGRLDTFQWPSSYHQFSWCFGVALVIKRQTGHGEEKAPAPWWPYRRLSLGHPLV